MDLIAAEKPRKFSLIVPTDGHVKYPYSSLNSKDRLIVENEIKVEKRDQVACTDSSLTLQNLDWSRPQQAQSEQQNSRTREKQRSSLPSTNMERPSCFEVKQGNKTALHVYHPPAIDSRYSSPLPPAVKFSGNLSSLFTEKRKCLPSGCFEAKQGNKTSPHVPYDCSAVGDVPFPVHAATDFSALFKEKGCLPPGCFEVKQGNKTALHVYHPPAIDFRYSSPFRPAVKFSGNLSSLYTEKRRCLPSGCFEVKQGNKTSFHVPYDPPCVGSPSTIHASSVGFLRPFAVKQPNKKTPLSHAMGFPFPAHAAAELSSLPSTDMEKSSKTRLKKIRIRQMCAVKKLRIRQTVAVKQYKKVSPRK